MLSLYHCRERRSKFERFRLALFVLPCLIAPNAFAQQAASSKAPSAPGAVKTLADYGEKAHEEARPQPPLFFREEWKRANPYPAEPLQHPMTQANVANPNLELKLYGPAGKSIQMSGAADLPDHPAHMYTGLCEQTCALALRDRNNYVDLSGYGKVHWMTRSSGLHQVHVIVKLADGRWLLAEHGDAAGDDLHPSEFTLSQSRWIGLDINRVVTVGRWLDKVDLSRVDEIGFTTLMPGSGHGYGGYVDVGWWEVWGRPVPRAGAAKQP